MNALIISSIVLVVVAVPLLALGGKVPASTWIGVDVGVGFCAFWLCSIMRSAKKTQEINYWGAGSAFGGIITASYFLWHWPTRQQEYNNSNDFFGSCLFVWWVSTIILAIITGRGFYRNK